MMIMPFKRVIALPLRKTTPVGAFTKLSFELRLSACDVTTISGSRFLRVKSGGTLTHKREVTVLTTSIYGTDAIMFSDFLEEALYAIGTVPSSYTTGYAGFRFDSAQMASFQREANFCNPCIEVAPAGTVSTYILMYVDSVTGSVYAT